ncbi:hypothetical protein KIW84_013809 [Lathyrus oleraceus]|uniref:Uncharacterized protein n=1 Tax=Pisum sativum TaxID=3888 RepID=A0A9D5BLE3_PEA|nr:hypothetical protein KIW84_013809 [Pisum sativum]
MSYAELYPSLVLKNLIQPRNLPQIPEPLPWWYKPELRCAFHQGAPEHDIENCYSLKYKVQKLMKSGMLSFEDRAPNVKANPLPAHGNSSVNMVDGCPGEFKLFDMYFIQRSLVQMHKDVCLPEKLAIQYDSNNSNNVSNRSVSSLGGQEVLLPTTNSVVSIADVTKVTRSGRVFGSVFPKDKEESVVSKKVKVPVEDPVGVSKGKSGESINLKANDNDEVLRLIKRKLPEEGRNHNLALHISMNCKEDALSNVLVDTGSSLNVLPKLTLSKLSYQGAPIWYSGVIVKAFDGSRKTVIGEVDFPVKIGPSDFQITFQVMDIHPTYSCLLGRPWIHEAGAVTSALHQKLKFVKNGKLVIVGGEKALLVSHLSSLSYVEAEDEVGTMFQALPIAAKKRVGAPISSLKDAKKIVEEGNVDQLVPNPIEYNDPSPSPNFEFLVFEAKEESDVEVSDELSHLLEQDEKTIQSFEEQIELVNLGSEDDVKKVKIGSRMCPDVKKGLIDLLREYSDMFAWSYQDMSGSDSEIMEHRLPLKPECPPVKQKLRRTHPDMAVKIKEEVQKKIDVGFLVTAEYPQWVANIVPVPKKDGKVRMCVDYRDLNKASPKDDFPLPHC